ncbi:MAG: hypothetical protein KGH57_04435 [Candidatus Micrarchaeota archaeon]|nr:hypothetical protein [Candidatus Micrarchaeota archaeon]
MRILLSFAVFFMLGLFAMGSVNAYFNATYLSTTVFLTNSTAAHVVEGIQLYVSNASISTYDQDRQAFNLSLGNWQKVIGNTPFLTQHILNPKSSISNFTFLPGPITPAGNGGGYASLTMSYDSQNVTSVVSIAPRQFEYRLNNSVFNYLHTASGQSLLSNARLTFIVPNGTQVVTAYPLPDFPTPNQFGKYSGTSFSWFSGEPLQNFNFVYLVTQTPEQEVVQFFNALYSSYGTLIYVLIILALVGIAMYVYFRFFR